MKLTTANITIDFSNLLNTSIGKNGIIQSEIENLLPKVREAKEKFLKEKNSLGFYTILFDNTLVGEIESFIANTSSFIDTIVIVGIGGSDLGVRAVHETLNHSFYNGMIDKYVDEKLHRKIYFAGDTTDPKPLIELFDIINLPTTLFLIISKSGGTIEPITSFLYILEQLKSVGLQANQQIAFITDPKRGELVELAGSDGYRTFPIPPEVGGRFSVLSGGGLLPLSFVGVDIRKMQSSAISFANELATTSIENDIALQYAAFHYLYIKRDYNINVFMPYIYSFKSIGKWLRQLWAESLGKDKFIKNTDKKVMTLVDALGPTDQHSQLQLYNDGPDDKVFTFVISESTERDIELKADGKNVYLNGLQMSEILMKELIATRQVLTDSSKPNITISLKSINEGSLAELLYFFELAVVYLGFMMEIDPFDQPGVESSKVAIKELIS